MIVKFLFLFLIAHVRTQANQAEVQYYVDLITKATEAASTYKSPTNAREFAPRSNAKPKKWGHTYDFIVIGAGAGGSAIANRLSEMKNWNVLVLEAGTPKNNLTDIPNMYFQVDSSKYNWDFWSIPQTTACQGLKNHQCPYPRGRGLGGTTLINGLVYCRGYSNDYQKLARVLNDEIWNYTNVLRLFKKSEDFHHNVPSTPFDPAYHGKGGYLRVQSYLTESPQMKAFLAANEELGYPTVDYNADKLGASPSQMNIDGRHRLDGASAFLLPILERENLEVLPSSYVTKISIDPKSMRATGVQFTREGVQYYAEASKEVIVSAGAIQTPQILLLSGIGPRKHLQDVGIDVVADLEVGSTLMDNPTFFGISFKTNYTEPIRPLAHYVEEMLQGRGELPIAGNNQAVAFYESSFTKGTDVADIEIMMVPANATSPLAKKAYGLTDETFEDTWKYINIPQSLIMYIAGLHGRSKGTVRLRSNNPYDYPLIDSKLLSDPDGRDIATLYDGVQLAIRLSKTKAFQAMDARLQSGPLRACGNHKYLTKDYWYCALRQMSFNLFHCQSTCPMGTDPKKGAVLDSKLKVYGIANLRVADASVFPFVIGAHPNAPTTMVAEQLGELIKEMYTRS